MVLERVEEVDVQLFHSIRRWASKSSHGFVVVESQCFTHFWCGFVNIMGYQKRISRQKVWKSRLRG